MMGNRPMIGITPGYDYEKNMLFVKNGYYNGILESGGLPAVIPVTSNTDVLDEFIDRCDGLLLCGGPDIDAKYFGELNRPFSGDISPYRDEMELYAAKRVVQLNKPLLGICRGIQIINVALGGTIYQDISAQISDRELVKHSQSAPVWYPTHDVFIERGTHIWSCFMEECMRVNSFHHQAVKDTAPGFTVTARASDGVIEAIEHSSNTFAVGVQWHPETMWGENRIFLNLFKALVEHCRK